MPDLETHERELKNTRQEVRNLQVMQMRPGQSAERLKVLADLERSARAEVKLRLRALAHAKAQSATKPSNETPPKTHPASPDGISRPQAGTYLMSGEQHLARAAQLREWNPNSRAAQLHELAARMRSKSR